MTLRYHNSRARTRAMTLVVPILLACFPSRAIAQTPSAGSFRQGSWNLQMTSSVYLESWNYNGSSEALFGGTAGVDRGISDRWSIGAEAMFYRVRQRTNDAFLAGLAGIVRWQFYRGARLALAVETGVGVARADVRVPPGGTRLNYLFETGAGSTYELRHRVHLLAGVRWVHLSNNGLEGQDRNPDIQALGGRLGVLLAF